MQRPTLSFLDYLKLLAVITLGVMLGSLGAFVVESFIAAKAAEQAIAEFRRTSTAIRERATQPFSDMAEQARAESEARTQQQQDARAASQAGRELFRLCQEWTESHDTNNVQATREGMDYHCARYSSYVETGVARPR